ncbi:hypothetical protein ACJRO7_033463 [Eucalyptus globulus]|uniref:Uncharacterized protein n=1 Tax=Eucalyptus globulus TaxID=34317 RepID=A0ABD3JPG7_EUCGL
MGACATKPKVSMSDKAAVDAPAPAPEEVVAGAESETTVETGKVEEVVVAAEAEQSESVKEVVDVEGDNKPRSLSLLLNEDDQKAKAGSEVTSSETTKPLEPSSEPQPETEESGTKPPEPQEPAPAVAAVEKEKAAESSPALAEEPTEKKTEPAEAIAKEEAKE